MSAYLATHRRGVCINTHTIIAERAFGGPLPTGAEVHHIDENGKNNSPTNLVICSHAYHALLHARMRSYAACGHYDWRQCRRCGAYDSPMAMRKCSKGRFQLGMGQYEHSDCEIKYRRKLAAKRKAVT